MAPDELKPATVAVAVAKAELVESYLAPVRVPRWVAIAPWPAAWVGAAASLGILWYSPSGVVKAPLTVLMALLMMRVVWSGQLRRARRAERLNAVVSQHVLTGGEGEQ